MTMSWMLPPGMAAETEKHWQKNREKRLPWGIRKMTTIRDSR